MRTSPSWLPWVRGALGLTLALVAAAPARAADPPRRSPNIVLVYFDDLGYGDVGCYGGTRIPTPHLDRMAREGLRFTSGYAAAATCTPSRYALLTGEYAFRREGTGILPGNAALIIAPGRTTLASLLAAAGYRTGVVGKWHLGLGNGSVDWNGEIKPGPLDVGFESSFIMAATGDRVPCVYVAGRQVVGLDPSDPVEVRYGQPFPGLPTGKTHPELLTMCPSHGHDMSIVNGISRIGYQRGGAAALWNDEDMADTFAGEAVRFIEGPADRPFFLYFALHDPHVPRVPHPRFRGRTSLGPRGDAIVQADWCLGQVLDALDRRGLARDTLLIVSSDNGPVLDDGYRDQAVELNGDHRPAGPLRGGKYSKFEGGCRVPWLVRWPARVRPGTSDAIICQVDLLASLGALVQRPFAAASAPDSQNVLAALLGESPSGREQLVEQGSSGLALRSGRWKFIPAAKGPATNPNTRIELGNAPVPQLYDLAADPGEQRNLAAEQPERVAELAARLAEIVGPEPPRPAR